MKFYSNHGKFMSRRKISPIIRILLVVLLLSMSLLVGVILLVLKEQGTPQQPQNSPTQVQEPVLTEPQPTEVSTVPTETLFTVEAALPEAATQPIPEEPEMTEKTILPQYASLYQQNSGLFGWIQIEGTKIDYPVMHTPDEPERYLHADFEGKYSYGGVPFLDAKCGPDSDNLLIYGHNMLDGSMCRSLMKYQEKTYWESHPTIQFNTLYEQQEFEVLAAFYDRVYLKTETVFKFYQFIDAADEAEFDYAVSQFKEKAIYDTGVEAAYGDQLITLVTCAYHTDNGRFVVVARKK